MDGEDELRQRLLNFQASSIGKLAIFDVSKFSVTRALPAWQLLAARIRTLTRFDDDSLELVEHECIDGHVSGERLLTIGLKSEQERIHGHLPSHVVRLENGSQVEASLKAQLDDCQSSVPQVLEQWRTNSSDPVAVPASSLFLAQARSVGYTIRCDYCSGRGKLDCQTCHRSGKVTCGRCSGRGNESCFTCSGRGYVRCSNCGGSGRQFNNNVNNQSCNTCGGGGETLCWSCGGSRNVTCQTCGGRREVTCGRCSGSGAITCTSCSGTGHQSVVGHIRCGIASNDTLAFQCPDRHLATLLDSFSTIGQAAQHVELSLTDYEVGTETLTSRVEGRFLADRFKIRVGSDDLDLYAMRYSGVILDYRNIVGRLLQADVDALKAARTAARGVSLLPQTEVVDGLNAVLASEAAALILQGKKLTGPDASLVSADFVKDTRDQVARTLRQIHSHLAAPLVLSALLMPFIGYDLAWRLPSDKHLNTIALLIFMIPLALGLLAEWLLRRHVFGQMSPVAISALKRIVRHGKYIRNTRIAIGISSFVGMVLAMRMWIF
jgi:hypothetical protein